MRWCALMFPLLLCPQPPLQLLEILQPLSCVEWPCLSRFLVLLAIISCFSFHFVDWLLGCHPTGILGGARGKGLARLCPLEPETRVVLAGRLDRWKKMGKGMKNRVDEELSLFLVGKAQP